MLFCISTFFFSIRLVQGQELIPPKYGLAINWLPGTVWVHSQSIRNLQSHTQGIELCALIQTQGNKPWHKWYGNPTIGYSATYIKLTDVSTTGDVIGLFSYMDFWLLHGKKWGFQFRLGTGVGIPTHPFHVQTNYQNKALSSYLNGVMQGLVTFRMQISPTLRAKIGGGITHVSNGSFTEPNYGLNLLHGLVGVEYQFWNSKPSQNQLPNEKIDSTGLLHEPKHIFQVNLAPGHKAYFAPYQYRNLFALSAGITYLYNLSPKNNLGAGMDIFFDRTPFYDPIIDKYSSTSFLNWMNVGLKVGHELKVNRMAFIFYMGAYLKNNQPRNGTLFQRIGIQYQPFQCITLGWYLKLHLNKADYLEWSIGYRI